MQRKKKSTRLSSKSKPPSPMAAAPSTRSTIVFSGPAAMVHEVERRMRVSDLVLKFINVRIDEKLKKIEKRKKIREKRAARKPAPQVSAPANPAPMFSE